MTKMLINLAFAAQNVIYGGYHWLPVWDNLPIGTSKIGWGAERLSTIGIRMIRLPLGYSTTDPFGNQPVAGIENYLVTMVRDQQYRNAIQTFDTIIFTTYTEQAYKNSPSQGGNWMNIDFEKERSEYQALAEWLDYAYPDKTFILLPWEGENEGVNQMNVGLYLGLIQARIKGIADAAASNVFSGMEITQPGGILTPYVKQMAPDYISWSAWTATSPTVDDASPNNFKARLDSGIKTIISTTGFKGDKVIIGEFGRAQNSKLFPYEWMSICDEVFKANKIRYAVYWQTLEDINGFGLFDKYGKVRPEGRYLKYFNSNLIITEVAEGYYCIPPSFGIPENEQ
jgi:hypothetical protein